MDHNSAGAEPGEGGRAMGGRHRTARGTDPREEGARKTTVREEEEQKRTLASGSNGDQGGSNGAQVRNGARALEESDMS